MSRECLDSGVHEAPLTCIELVARVSGVSVARILARGRADRDAVLARHVAIWATRQRTTLSYPALGALFGGRDHRTVMNSCERVAEAVRLPCRLGDLARRVREELLREVA